MSISPVKPESAIFAFDSPISLPATGTEVKSGDAAVMAAQNSAVATAFLPAGVTAGDLAEQLNPTVSDSPEQKAQPANFTALIGVGETESNDTVATADAVPLGFDLAEDVAVDVSGSIDTVIATSEDDGSILLANPTGVVSGATVVASATIGDGPYGGTSGDYDFYEVAGVLAGDVITIEMNAFDFGSSLDPVVGIYDSAGTLLDVNDDFYTLDSFLQYTALAPDTYYVVVAGFAPGLLPADPFDSSSGLGVGSTGFYDVRIGLNTPFSFLFSAEDDGSIPSANATGVVSGSTAVAIGIIGDGPYGASSGDYDFYHVAVGAAGDVITVDMEAYDLGTGLDPVVGVYDSAGALLAFNDDYGFSLDSYLEFTAPAAGDYFVMVRGFGSGFQADPFDSSSGFSVGSVGYYAIRIGLNAGDFDYYAVELDAGDILGANVSGGANGLSLGAASGVEMVGSHQDATFIHPTVSPLPGGGNAALSWVVDTPGTYFVRVSGALGYGPYDLNLRVFRPALEAQQIGAHQTLFLDFDGEVIDRSIFGLPGMAALSPLSSFLAGWGLAPGDESAVIDAIVAAVEENLSQDLRALGNNGDYDASGVPGEFDIEILNSRDDADPFGMPNVSRVVIGGTIPELGIGTIGISEAIDVGNFDTSETAVVLLDLLSAGAANPNSLNQFPLVGGATIFDLIGTGVGNIASHEAGHFFANFHTDQLNGFANADLMDQGGFLANTVGVGPDSMFGSLDDVDVDFGNDTYVPNEGFTGVENTLNAISYGLSTGTVDTIAPTVTSVVVASPDWSPAFLNYLQTHGLGVGGYAIPDGSGDQLVTLPWMNIRQIKIGFSEDVVVAADDLKVAGANVANYAFQPGGFSYDAATHTATWTLAQYLYADKLVLALDSDSAVGVHDPAGNALDGEWDNPTSPADPVSDSFPSGNGLAGADFHFRINVLSGDTSGNGRVFFEDIGQTAGKSGKNTGSPQYNPRNDLDGSGAISFIDVLNVLGRIFSRLPSGEPVAPAFAPAPMVADAVFEKAGSRPAVEDPATQQLAFLDDTLDELAGARRTPPEPASTVAPLAKLGTPVQFFN